MHVARKISKDIGMGVRKGTVLFFFWGGGGDCSPLRGWFKGAGTAAISDRAD